MVSVLNLAKRMSWASGERGRLAPFFKLVAVYFCAWGAGSAAGPSPAALAAKCAPVICLMLLVAAHNGTASHPQRRYGRRVACGLALSALGDALLLWPQHFVPGMAAFGAAHASYLAAFGWRPRTAALAAAYYAATAAYLTCVRPPGVLRVLVPAYAALLATMAWRGSALLRAPRLYHPRAACAAAGALLFLISDAILAYNLFGAPVPYKQVLVMSTYYLGQLGIAASALAPFAPAA